MRPFARGYPTFEDWNTNRSKNKYATRIIRKQYLFPGMTRQQLEEIPYKDLTVTWKRWEELNPDWRRDRVRAVQVIRRLRAGEDIERALEEQAMFLGDAVCHLAPYHLWFDEKRQAWICSPSDKIEVEMHFYDRDEGLTSIVTKDSRDRSLIGRHMAAVHQALNSGDPAPLRDFIGGRVFDAYGRAHYFETDLDRLYQISDMLEEPEFFEIYSNGD